MQKIWHFQNSDLTTFPFGFNIVSLPFFGGIPWPFKLFLFCIMRSKWQKIIFFTHRRWLPKNFFFFSSAILEICQLWNNKSTEDQSTGPHQVTTDYELQEKLVHLSSKRKHTVQCNIPILHLTVMVRRVVSFTLLLYSVVGVVWCIVI